MAADSTQPLWQALARFALFEGVRLNLVLAVDSCAGETLDAGLTLPELNQIAESQVMHWLAEEPAVPEDTRPFSLIVTAAMVKLTDRSQELHSALMRVHSDVTEAISRRARLETALAEIDIVDALLIRNAVAPAFGEQRLSVERLMSQHSLLLGGSSREALDQRLHRAVKKGVAGLRRRRIALLDLLRKRNSA